MHLIFGDLHMDSGAHLSRSPDARLNMVLQTITSVVDEITQRFEISKITFLGDIWNGNKPAPKYVHAFGDLLKRIKSMSPEASIYVLAGNHDWAYDGCIVSAIGSLCDSIHTIEHGTTYEECGTVYIAHGVDPETVDTEGKIVFGHFSISGAKLANGHTIGGNIQLSSISDAKLAILGDIHVHQKLADSVYYLGSPYPIKINDIGRHYYCIINSNDDPMFFPTPAPQIVKTTLDECDRYNSPKWIPLIETNDCDRSSLLSRLDKCHAFHILNTTDEAGAEPVNVSETEIASNKDLLIEYADSRGLDEDAKRRALEIYAKANI